MEDLKGLILDAKNGKFSTIFLGGGEAALKSGMEVYTTANGEAKLFSSMDIGMPTSLRSGNLTIFTN